MSKDQTTEDEMEKYREAAAKIVFGEHAKWARYIPMESAVSEDQKSPSQTTPCRWWLRWFAAPQSRSKRSAGIVRYVIDTRLRTKTREWS